MRVPESMLQQECRKEMCRSPICKCVFKGVNPRKKEVERERERGREREKRDGSDSGGGGQEAEKGRYREGANFVTHRKLRDVHEAICGCTNVNEGTVGHDGALRQEEME